MAKEKTEFRWWLNTLSMGMPCLLEITQINGYKVSSEDTPPSIRETDTVTVDRAICCVQMQPGSGKFYIGDIRPNLGAILASEDPTCKASRRPINFKAKSLFEGAYLWIDYDAPGETQLHELAYSVYTPQDQRIVVPNSSPLDLSGSMPKSMPGGAADVIKMFGGKNR